MITTACTALLSLPLVPFDEGYDFLLLEMPRAVVAGDTLRYEVLGRPGNPWVVLGDAAVRTRFQNGIYIQLQGTGALFVLAAGFMPATGNTLGSLTIPNAPELDGATVWFQAFGDDGGVINRATSSDSKPLTIHRDNRQPLVSLLTVNRIPADQNGSERNEGTLAVPTTGFSVDLTFAERGAGPLDQSTLQLTANAALANGTIAPGTNLASFVTFRGNTASGIVDSTWAFPNNTAVTLTATIRNLAGNISPAVTYRVTSKNFPTSLRPFLNRQVWYLDFLTTDLDRTGVPDAREDLLLFGLGQSATEIAGPSFRVAQWCQDQVVLDLRRNYGVGTVDAVNIDFSLARPTGTFSTICVGGRNPYPASSLPPGALETTGAAYFDPLNQAQEVLCGGVLGTHPRSIYYLFRSVPAFRQVFDPLNQTPVGTDPDDQVVTAVGFDPGTATVRQRTRYQVIKNGVEAYANAVSFVVTQETSHSMGLVPSGPLPFGLLGEYYFGHSTFGHFDDGRGNFLSGNNSTPAPAQPANLALIWDHFQSGRAHFTALNWAYLRERIING
jgi:hypothetical protein